MAIKKTILILAGFLVGAFTMEAQQGVVKITLGPSGATPMGQLKNLVNKTTFRGADISIMYGINDRLSAGLNGSFHDFYQKFPRAVYKLTDGSDISAVLTNSVQTIPFLATAEYNLGPKGYLQPFVSAGAGGALVMNSQYIGEYPNEDNEIAFALRPGAGLFIPFRKAGEAGINLGVNYTFITYKRDDISNLGYLGFTIGVEFPSKN